MLNKELMIEILKEKIEEGYDIIRGMNIASKDFGTTVVNMFELDKTINQLQQENDFDKEMIEKLEEKQEYVEVGE